MAQGLDQIIEANEKAFDKSRESLDVFYDRVKHMNKTFNLQVNENLTDLGVERVVQIHRVMREEVDELLEAIEDGKVNLVKLADTLGDIKTYNDSEFIRWGIPAARVCHAIMDSQDSKLVDGKPLMAPDGSKFIKGPNYVPPEPEIEKILKESMEQ